MAIKQMLAALAALPMLVACNTINGIGQDVQAVGQGVSGAATYVQRQMFSSEPRTQTASVTYREPTVSVGEPCDPDGSMAGSGLPPCVSTQRLGSDTPTARLTTSSVVVPEPHESSVRLCDPGGELDGGDGLPPCRVTAVRVPAGSTIR